MDILKALRAEESKFEAQMEAARQQLETVRHAIKMLSGTSSGNGRSRHMSASARAKIAKAQKARWAKFRVAKKANGKG
jgi:glutamine synthetase adenylyltransferase